MTKSKAKNRKRAAAVAGAAPCSASELRVLEALSAEQWTPASWLAKRVWEKQRGPVGKRAGQWQRMGAMLHKLYARGLVHKMTTAHAQNLWRRRRTPNDQADRPEADHEH